MLDFSSAEHAVRASGPGAGICLDIKQMGVSVRHLESHACHCTPLPQSGFLNKSDMSVLAKQLHSQPPST